MSSCTDDTLNPDSPGGSESGIAPDGYYLSFRVGLNTLGNLTRDGEEDIPVVNTYDVDETYENYVDPGRLYVMFFLKEKDDKIVSHATEGGTYKLFKMFKPNDNSVSMIPVAYSNTGDAYDKNWYVRLSVPDITTNNGITGEIFAQTLRKYEFKVAVMANADPRKPIELNEATYDASTGEISLGDDIFLIHRQSGANDPYVKDTLNDEGEVTGTDSSVRNVYSFLYGNQQTGSKYLGQYTDWVGNNNPEVSSKNNVTTWIRSHWNPDGSYTYPYGSKDYTDIWSLWNFGGIATGNAILYDTFQGEWLYRNGNFLQNVIETALGTDDKIVPDFQTYNYDGISEDEEENPEYGALESRTLEFRNFTSDDKCIAVKNNGYYGIRLRQNRNKAGTTSGNYTKFKSNDVGCFTFEGTTTGTLYITASNDGTENSAKVVAQVGKSDTKSEFSFSSATPKTISKKIDLTGNSETVYVYLDSYSKSQYADIYQIEYIQDEYVWGTDRKGIAPSEDHPIEMYGTQNYGKLGDLWPEGTSFDLDQYNGTSDDFEFPTDPDNSYFHPIPLLRSVAKVELLIPNSIHAHHVYLRSVNRYARWEPVDVSSNTMDIWTDDLEDFNVNHNSDCEWFHIKKQPIFYDTNKTKGDTEIQLSDYKNKLAWYYGTWADENNNVGGVSVTTDDTVDDRKGFDFPHIMNPLISRSDFVQFMTAKPTGIYDRFVLYVGEKFIDDPNNLSDENGIEWSTPKVCHIEFRRQGDPYANLDDNNCYRIYFTEDGYAGINGDKTKYPTLEDDDHSWERLYEKDPETLAKHWPIMRNHTYRFIVDDVTNNAVVLRLEVLPWRKTDDIKVSW